MLAGDPPRGCQVCYKTLPELDAISVAAGRADTRLVLESKDGIYQILCVDCDKVYQQKRRDLYGGTPYGKKQGIAA